MTQYFARVHFGKNFVKVTFLLNKLPKSWFDEIFFSTLWVCNSQCGKTRNSFSPKKKFRQINYLVIKHEYLRSCASRCLSLSSSSSFPGVLEIHRDTRAFILDLASGNFLLDINVHIFNFDKVLNIQNSARTIFDFIAK